MKPLFLSLLMVIAAITASGQPLKTDTLYTTNENAYRLKYQGRQMLIGGATMTTISGTFWLLTGHPKKSSVKMKMQQTRQISAACIGVLAGITVMIIGYSKLHKAGVSIKGNMVSIDL